VKYILLLLTLSVLNNCHKKEKGMVVCVQKKIEEIKKEPVWNPPAEVNEYTYEDKQVFLFTSDCCDQYIMLYDGSCKYICAPSGGIDGTGDGKCDDFFKKATHVRLIWKDPR
jgi:hypothetical protein